MSEDVRSAYVEIRCGVRVAVSDDAPGDWITRVTVPDEFPYWNRDGSPFSVAQGVEMLAYNAVANGIEDASRLDGWGDLQPGMVTLSVVDVEVD